MLPATPARISSLTLLIAKDAAIVVVSISGLRIIRIGFRICEEEGKGRSKSRTQRSRTAQQQRKHVEQASASSGNQCLLGHRSVPRIGLFAFDDSTNGGRAMYRRQAQLAGALDYCVTQEKYHAVGD